MVSYAFGIVSFVSVFLYSVQFVVYTKKHLQRQTKNLPIQVKDLFQRFPKGETVKKIAIVCYEYVKGGFQSGLGYELEWKLTHGGMNNMSP